jgi:SAM-dependent methyltransferase
MDLEPRPRGSGRVAVTDDSTAFNELERTMWEQRATAYADSFERLTALTIEPLLDAAGVHAGTELLDIGTGPGFVAAAAAARGANVTGIDVADAMVELAKSRVPTARFRRASAEDLPLPDGGFDAVVGNFVIFHLGHPDRGVAEARRVLRPGGRIALSLWRTPAENRACGVVADAIDLAHAQLPADVPTGPSELRYADRAAVTALLHEAGFEAITITDFSTTLSVDAERWWESVLRSTPRTGPLIASQTPGVQADIRARYDELVAGYENGAEVALPVAAVLASAVAPKA